MIKIKAYGKINLGLKVLGKRSDGYHNIESLMQGIDLFDTLLVERANGFHLETQGDPLDMGPLEENTMYKAWEVLKRDYPEVEGLAIQLDKRIPVAAGLAGGSADGAAALVALNEIYSLGLTPAKLEAYAKALGADAPFMLRGGAAYATGIGQDLETIPGMQLDLVLINPGFPVSTAEVYQALGSYRRTDWSFRDLKEAYERKDLDQLSIHMANDLEAPLLGSHEEVRQMKKDLKDLGARVSLLSGSGPTVWGWFANQREAQTGAEELRSRYPFVRAVRTQTQGPGIILERK